MAKKMPYRKRVLLVEDDLQDLLTHALNLAGAGSKFSLLLAETGTEAVRKAELHRPEVILMDIRLPKMDGITATKEIRKFLPEAYIIVMTAYPEAEMKKRVMEAGANEYMTKPIDFELLINRVRQLIGGEKK